MLSFRRHFFFLHCTDCLCLKARTQKKKKKKSRQSAPPLDSTAPMGRGSMAIGCEKGAKKHIAKPHVTFCFPFSPKREQKVSRFPPFVLLLFHSSIHSSLSTSAFINPFTHSLYPPSHIPPISWNLCPLEYSHRPFFPPSPPSLNLVDRSGPNHTRLYAHFCT